MAKIVQGRMAFDVHVLWASHHLAPKLLPGTGQQDLPGAASLAPIQHPFGCTKSVAMLLWAHVHWPSVTLPDLVNALCLCGGNSVERG